MTAIAARVAESGGRVRTLSTVGRTPSAGIEPDDRPTVELELEVEIDDADEHALIAALEDLDARPRHPPDPRRWARCSASG